MTEPSTPILPPTPLPTRAEDVPAAFAARFNSGDPEAVRALYEPGAAFVPESGVPVHGDAAIAAQNAPFLALGLPISVRTRQAHIAGDGDIALLVVDWEIGGEVRATATDVARRGADGYWRYVIDSPFGAAPRSD
ncbi:YybH family protein [Streptomyces sp. AN091965]|uniref:YybH family protein n=1 Tax=Streptomyces sp. AN091965 TaxID=2927803 RepID=UPI001F6140D6|nr:nuclear transport factor 2 family protein [Streptomyces sp. AN091965]MCI3932732.1 nuclear transport factor 2 family protein [Streptomyces sp. AN091965]